MDDLDDAKRASEIFGHPLMRRLAYDGRRNAVAHSEEELSSAVASNMFIIKDLSAIIVGISYVWYLNCVINHVMLQLSFFFWIGMLHMHQMGLNPQPQPSIKLVKE